MSTQWPVGPLTIQHIIFSVCLFVYSFVNTVFLYRARNIGDYKNAPWKRALWRHILQNICLIDRNSSKKAMIKGISWQTCIFSLYSWPKTHIFNHCRQLRHFYPLFFTVSKYLSRFFILELWFFCGHVWEHFWKICWKCKTRPKYPFSAKRLTWSPFLSVLRY